MFKSLAMWIVKKELCQGFTDLPVELKELLLRCDSEPLEQVVHWAAQRYGSDWLSKKIFFDVIEVELDKLDKEKDYLVIFFRELRKELRDRNPWFSAMQIKNGERIMEKREAGILLCDFLSGRKIPEARLEELSPAEWESLVD